MDLLSRADFLSWAAEGGIVPHPGYPQSAQLVFRDAPEDQWRAWETPGPAAELTGFVNALLEAAAPAGPFVLSVRGGAPWFTGTGYNEGPHVEQLRDRIVGTLPIPRAFDGALRFEVAEWRDVLMLLTTFLVYGWCVSDDLELVAGHRATVLMTSHHSYVAVHTHSAAGLAAFEASMLASGFPREPSEPPSAPAATAG